MVYLLIVSISLRYLLFDYYLFSEYIHPYIMSKVSNKYLAYVYKELRLCNFCSGYQVGCALYILFFLLRNSDISVIGTSAGWNELLHMFLFAVCSGYMSRLTRAFLEE